ncbi:CDP-diacylglycerol--serine O-phosphatidyltransferase [Fulvivirga maritima]|uniref:CDP-diacylglycerol--serine O-phosphatidyltransferase n=1 Tax=Fulvivirga maritima TaxID=2904247 RepID=UPI001F26D258|nr:CDP-diacylglycerol--serine O-phosphatidyltransferase [Fulvivirga maritima]UII28583.1 CDP-diacylglycerol--serine O-phosphatidyltransferase [Fulvivirga maritima]
MNIKKHIPNTLTASNLACGCVGITLAANGELIFATYMIWAALIFDFLDGFVARLLKVSSPIGKELDSLADMVTFGVLPGLIMYELLSSYTVHFVMPFAAFLIAVFSALRLAKFNIDDRQQSVFIGLPTPANALFISSIAFVTSSEYRELINFNILITITVVFSLLLVAPVELFSLKLKSMNWKENIFQILLLVVSVILILMLKIFAIPFIIVAYIVLSLIKNITKAVL